jgi:hypothetical protein
MSLQLRNSLPAVPDPRGNRYAAPDREDAYFCWLAVGRRSFAATSVRTGIAENTLRAWAKADDWAGRARDHDEEAAELGRVAVLATVTAELDPSVHTIVAIRDDPTVPPKVRLEAALALLGLGGLAPLRQAAPRPGPPSERETASFPYESTALPPLPPDVAAELAARVFRQVDDGVVGVVR